MTTPHGRRISYLAPEEVQQIHANAMGLLEEQGFFLDHAGALALLADHGAKVDMEARVVRVEPDLVQRCIDSAPREVLLAGRDPDRDRTLRCDPAVPVTRNGGGVDRLLDPETGEDRDMGLDDVRALTWALDAMDGVDMIAPLYPRDVPEDVRDLVVLQTLLGNTSKHVNVRTFSKRNLSGLLRMGELVAGGREALRERPVFSLFDSPVSPLRFPELTVDVYLEAGAAGVPLFVANLPIAGATGPFPLAGMVQLLHTELLASVVICQTANPGAPLILHPLAMTMDWKTAIGLTGSIEATMITAGAVQVANEVFGLPVDVHGPWSDTFTADPQSMMERTFQTLVPALAGAASIAGFGDLQEGLIFCPVQLGLDEELIAYTRRALEGFPVDEDRLAVEAIKRVGFTGNYMTDPTTMSYLRSDYHQPRVLNRVSRQTWEQQGRPDANARARERVLELMQSHEPPPLDEGLARELQDVIEGLGG